MDPLRALALFGYGGAAAGAAAAAAAAEMEAIKASGAIVRVEPQEFQRLLARLEDPVVIMKQGFRSTRYATAHKGFVFWTKHSGRLELGRVFLVRARGMHMPA